MLKNGTPKFKIKQIIDLFKKHKIDEKYIKLENSILYLGQIVNLSKKVPNIGS